MVLELKANAKGTVVSSAIRISAADLAGKTVGEILLGKGYLKETPELLQAYEESAARYFEWRGRYGEQFSASGTVFFAEDPNATHRDTDWARKDVLVRAQRWGAVTLIDEADVYIKRREDGIAMNAVVGVFLRVLEYFNGPLFLTTNRVDDIDEAIVSRCIALIKYTAPDGAARRRIWQVMAAQFGLELSAPLLDELVERFPTASGRGIKGLAKLVAKYWRHKNIAPSLDTFWRCALFHALDAAPAPAAERRLNNLWFI